MPGIPSGSRNIVVTNIASTVDSQSGSRDFEVTNIASTISSQSGSRDIKVKNIDATVSSQSGVRDIEVKNIASTVSSKSGGRDIEEKNIFSTVSSQSGSRSSVVKNIALNSSRRSDMFRDDKKPPQSHLATDLEDTVPTTLLESDESQKVPTYYKNCNTASADVDSLTNSLEVHLPPLANDSDDLSSSLFAPTSTFIYDSALSIVAPTPINCDDMKLSNEAPTAINSDDLNLFTAAATEINCDDLTLSSIAPTTINSDDLSISTIAPTAFIRDELKLSIVAPTTINSDDLALSTLTKLGIVCNETDVKNKEFQNTSQFESNQSTCEQICLMLDLRLTSCSAKEVKDGTVRAKNVSSTPEFPKESNTLDTDFVSSYDKQEAIKSKVECDMACEQTLTTSETFMHKNAKEMNAETNEVEHNERTRVAAMIGHKETIDPSAVAMETQNLRDLAYPGSLCSILYKEVLKLDRTELESIAVILEQAQEICFTMAPRTSVERKILLESQRQERLERSLNVQNENLDELTQRLFDTIIHFLETKIVETVKFAKYIPGFKTLDIADQITLIKDANLINLTPHVCRVINSETQLVTYLPGLHVGFEEFCENFSDEIKELLKVGEMKGNQLNITAREEALLQAIFLVSTYERNSLKNPERVEDIYRKLVSCLLHVVSMEPTPVFQRMDELSDMILFARHLREYHYRFMLRQIMNFSKNSNDLTIHEIYEKYI